MRSVQSLRCVFVFIIGLGAAILPLTVQAEDPQLIPPRGYEAGGQYPVVVFLPYTGGSAAEQAAAFGFAVGRQPDFLLILPPGRFSRSDYESDFPAFVDEYERTVLDLLSAASQQYSIDQNRIYLAGYSLGGDLAWALSVRNPSLFAGAVVAGSRSSYPITAEARRALRQNGFRAAFLIGSDDSDDRITGIDRAYRTLNQDGITAVFQEFDGGHELPPQTTLQNMLSFAAAQAVVMSAPSAGRSGTNRAPGAGSAAGGAADASDSAGNPQAGSPAQSGSVYPDENDGVGETQWDRVGAAIKSAVFRQPSRHFGLQYDPFFAVGRDGFQRSQRHALTLRAEGLFNDIYLRGLSVLEERETSGDYRLGGFRQEIAIAYGQTSMLGLGLGWDWGRWMDYTGDGAASSDAVREYTLSAFWILPRGMRATPASVLQLRYTIPRSLNSYVSEQLLNLEVLYHIHVNTEIRLNAAAGIVTDQNQPYTSPDGIANALDRRMYWTAGFSYTIPPALRWTISHTGTDIRVVDGAHPGYSGLWHLSVEYLY